MIKFFLSFNNKKQPIELTDPTLTDLKKEIATLKQEMKVITDA
jgi:hypothetical protein